MPVGGDLKYIDFSVVPPQRCQLLEISNLEIFFQTSIPPPPMEFTNAAPPENFPLNLDTYSPPPFTKQFCGKSVDLSVRDFNWLNTNPIKLSLV